MSPRRRVGTGAGAGERSRSSGTRCPGLSRRSSSGSASASTISSRSRQPRKASARPSTPRAARVCHNVPAIGGTSLVSEVRAAYRDESGQIHKLTAPGRLGARHALPPVLESAARLPAGDAAGSQHHRAPGADSRSSAPDWSKRSRDETLSGARRSRRSQRRRHQRPRRARRRRRHRPGAHRPVRLEGAARDAAHLQRRRLSERDGDHQRAVPGRSGGRGARRRT